MTPVSLKISRGGFVTSYDSTDFFHGNRLFMFGGSYYAKTIANTWYARRTFFWEVVIFELNTLNKESLRPYHLEYWSLCLEQCQLLGSVFKPSLSLRTFIFPASFWPFIAGPGMLVAQLLFRQLFAVVWNRRAVGRGGEDKDLAHPKFGDFQMFSSKMEVSMNFMFLKCDRPEKKTHVSITQIIDLRMTFKHFPDI